MKNTSESGVALRNCKKPSPGSLEDFCRKDREPSRRLHPEVLAAFPGPPLQGLAEERLGAIEFGLPVDATLLDRLTEGISRYRNEASRLGYDKLVVGLSGGLDSVLCAALCRRSCRSAGEVLAVTVRFDGVAGVSPGSPFATLARVLDVTPVAVDGLGVQAAFQSAWPPEGAWSAINIYTRTIQSLIFQVADSARGAVVATTDRSEILLGRHTEGFYGQLAPLAGLYKSEAWKLADLLGVSEALLDARPGCEKHWYDDEILGVGYDVLDPLLHLISDPGGDADSISAQYGIEDREWMRALAARVATHSMRTTTRSLSREFARGQ